MICTSSQKNSQTGQGLGPGSPYPVVRGSIDQVRFTGTRKIYLGRSREILTQESDSGSLDQRSSDLESLAGWLYLGNRRKGQEAWVK